MTILTFIETLIHIIMIFESFTFFTLFMASKWTEFYDPCCKCLDGRVVGLLEAGSHGSFERSYMAS